MAEAPGASLVVRPGPPLAGVFTPPGDKSITHRAFLLGLLAEGVTVVENPNPGADCESTLACLVDLGAEVTRRAGTVAIAGCSMRLREPEGVLDCGNSGTTLRLLAGPLAAQDFLSVLTGDASLRRRPVGRVVEPLRAMGASLWAREGGRLPPLVVRGAPLTGMSFDRPTASAQVASSILLAGLGARGTTAVRTAWGVRNHTPLMLPAFHVPVESVHETGGSSTFTVRGPAVPRAARLRVPGDFSAAAFFLAAAAATPGARVTARGVNVNMTRIGLLRALEEMGATVERRELEPADGERLADVTVTGPESLRATTLEGPWVPFMVDEVPAWAIAAACARGVSRVSGAAELRLKESDRLASLARNLSGLGIAVEEHPDGLSITGGPIRGGAVDAGGDHRIAMAFAALATRAEGPIAIGGAEGIPTSFPAFIETLAALGGSIERAAAGAP